MHKDFWKELFSDWQGIVSTSGSVCLVLLGLIFWDHPTPRWITIAIGGLCIIFASQRIWEREHVARLRAEAEIARLLVKPSRSPAEQHDYELAKNALKLLKMKGLLALRHIRKQGSLTFGIYPPVLAAGLSREDHLWVYNHCAVEGILTQGGSVMNNDRTFAVSPKMEKILDELLYDDESMPGMPGL
jgi:hypothetical protein